MSDDKTFDQILAEEKVAMAAEKQTSEERAREEEERAREKREQDLRRAAAVNHDALYKCFASADINSQEGTDRALNAIQTATAVLQGEQPSSASASVPVPITTPSTTSNIPFDWDSLNEDQKKAIQLIADNKNRFFVKPSGSLGDKRGRELDQAHRAANQPAVVPGEPAQPATSEGNGTEAPASAPEPTPAPTPAVMPAKKAVAKKTTAAPAVKASGTSAEQKKQPLVARLKAAGQNAIKNLD